MDCTLNRFQEYTLNKVTKDGGTGEFAVFLTNPPETCKEGIFNSKKAQLIIDKTKTASILSYDSVHGRPVISMPSQESIVIINKSENHFMFWALVSIGVIAGAIWLIRKFKKEEENENSFNTAPSSSIQEYKSTYTPTYRASSISTMQEYASSYNSTTRSNPVSTTVINNNSGIDGLVTGMLIGNILIDNHHSHNNDPSSDSFDPSRSSSDNGNSFSSDNNSSYSSDSGSSFSNDSGSSMSSDNDSSFSSDSGSSFSSD